MDVRPIRKPAQQELLIAIHNAVESDDPIALEDHRAHLSSARDSAEFLAWDEGRAVGKADVAIEPTREIPYAHIHVLPDERRRGAGSALYAAVSAWARQRGREEIEVPVRDDDEKSLAFAERRGFRENGRERGLALDLTTLATPAVAAPDGIEIVTWADRPELAGAIYDVYLESVVDIPGEEDYEIEPFEGWLAHDMSGPGDKPEATFVALAGDEVVGYSKFSLTSAQPKVAHHDLTAVKRAWRNKGIARALKEAQIAWAKRAGYKQLRTRNEERNMPIRKLNARFGYKPAPGRIYLRGPVAS